MPSDHKHILNFIAGRRGDALEEPVLDACPEYAATNAKLHGAFAARAWRLLLESDEDMAPVARCLAASGLRELRLGDLK